MSKYIPVRSLNKEFEQQMKRRENGLKTGFYVKYPDAEKGPYIIKASDKPKYDELKSAIDLQVESEKGLKSEK